MSTSYIHGRLITESWRLLQSVTATSSTTKARASAKKAPAKKAAVTKKEASKSGAKAPKKAVSMLVAGWYERVNLEYVDL